MPHGRIASVRLGRGGARRSCRARSCCHAAGSFALGETETESNPERRASRTRGVHRMLPLPRIDGATRHVPVLTTMGDGHTSKPWSMTCLFQTSTPDLTSHCRPQLEGDRPRDLARRGPWLHSTRCVATLARDARSLRVDVGELPDAPLSAGRCLGETRRRHQTAYITGELHECFPYSPFTLISQFSFYQFIIPRSLIIQAHFLPGLLIQPTVIALPLS